MKNLQQLTLIIVYVVYHVKLIFVLIYFVSTFN
uniref:Uncharacterized protein n=1 Tax=Lepeophtheirus salmonis TaxID=72036 RepID=A0A0K2SWK7_LEPSM